MKTGAETLVDHHKTKARVAAASRKNTDADTNWGMVRRVQKP